MKAQFKACDAEGAPLSAEAEAHYAKAVELARAGKTPHDATQRVILAVFNAQIERIVGEISGSPLAFVVGTQMVLNDMTGAGDAVALALKSWFEAFEVPLEIREQIGLALARANADAYAQHVLQLSSPHVSPLKH